MPILRTEQLEKTFSGSGAEAAVAAVRGVDLAVDAGGFVAITGASGSGKSTLLHMLGGITRPTAGRVFLEDVDLAVLGDDDLAAIRRRRIGFVFQRYNLLPELSLVENVALPLALDGVAAARSDVAAREALEAVGMAHRAGHRPDELSGGEQQRVAIARAFVNRPMLLIADEPTGNLDPGTSIGIMKLLDRINKLGTTVVMSTHDSQIVDQMRRRVIELDTGHIVRDQSRGVYGYAR